jgi:hypothetical protein
MFGAVDKTLIDFGRIFVRAEMLVVVVIAAVIFGIGAWAVEQGREKGDASQEKYGFMFIGGAVAFLVTMVLFAVAVGRSDRLAGLAGFGALLRGLRA